MAFPIPNLPTDNLYKFAAVSGLFTMLASTLLLSYDLSQLFNLQSTISGTQKNIDFLQNLADASTKTRGDEYHTEAIELQKNNTQLLEQYNYLKNSVIDRQRLLTWALVAGGVSATLGFYFWYIKVQRPLDQTTALNLKKLQSEVSPPISEETN